MSDTTQDPDPSETPSVAGSNAETPSVAGSNAETPSVAGSNAETPSVAVPALPDGEFAWHRLVGVDELDVGRVTTVTVERESLCVTRTDTGFGCLANACPHQGGPLGEGSIEGGWLRCPWHGYDYSPTNGKPPPPFDDAPAAYRTEVRPDGVYVALPVLATRTRTVSDQLVETMTAWGVGWVFGMVGHSNLGFADALRTAEARGSLQFIGVRHEGAASFAATAYGKLTGSLAACFAIAGPGSTNLLTGLYDAKMDRAPVLALSGQVPSSVRGRGAFQDTDLSAAFADVARYSQTVQAGSDATELMNLACKTALVERDVAHLVLPDEVQVLPAPAAQRAAGSPEGRTGDRGVSPAPSALDAAVDVLSGAARPMIIVGHGARNGIDDIVALAESIDAPIATTFKGKGLIADQHPLACGVLGRSGTPIASWFMNEADALVTFGVSFANHTGIASYKPIVQVDFDPMALGRFHAVTVPMLADVGTGARTLASALESRAARGDTAAEVAERWDIWRAEKQRRRDDDRGSGMNSAVVFETLSRLVPADAIMTVDVGNHAYSFGRYFEPCGQTVLMSGYLGSIGFAFPAAMGCWAATQRAPSAEGSPWAGRAVVSVSGDGGFGQYAMELTTAVKYGMDITHVLLNNGELGKISKEQRAAELDVWQTSLHNPSFAEFAELCGVMGSHVTTANELDTALIDALAHPGPALVEVMTDPLLV
ncbi:thiamine pyrophosphate-binding protein [Candidatus Poriferisodalis sp.]|uniref:thiamine pyrophosphate-binding protein n=1 Tax=Candidatus Poriferisodalis sp. TaxID=3101277 RepID=UPI003B51E930